MLTLGCLQRNIWSTLSGSAVLRWFGIALEPVAQRPSFASAVSYKHHSDEIGASRDHKLMSPPKQSANLRHCCCTAKTSEVKQPGLASLPAPVLLQPWTFPSQPSSRAGQQLPGAAAVFAQGLE